MQLNTTSCEIYLFLSTIILSSFASRFFDTSKNVARSWMKKELVKKMLDPEDPPKVPVFKDDNIKKRYIQAKSMAVDALGLSTIERIEKYSFVSLYINRDRDMTKIRPK